MKETYGEDVFWVSEIGVTDERAIEPGNFKIFVGNSSDAKSLSELSLTVVE